MARDDFHQSTKRELAQRASHHCSNQECQKPTSAASGQPTGSVSIGVAAHIAAASKGGPRFNKFMTPVERSSLSNGIWLCYECSVIIDRDAPTYSETTLHDWRQSAEQRGREARWRGTSKSAATTDATRSHVLIPIDFPIALEGSLAPEVDASMLGKRLAVHLARREPFEVIASFARVDGVQPDDDARHAGALDSFELEQFKWHLRARAAHLVRSTHIHYSDLARDAWSGVLTDLIKWSVAFNGLISLFRDQRPQGEKFDLWCAHEQQTIGAIYLSEADVTHVLSQLGFSNPPNLIDLAGVPLGGADLLSSSEQVAQAIPRISYELGRQGSQISGAEALALNNWQLGLG